MYEHRGDRGGTDDKTQDCSEGGGTGSGASPEEKGERDFFRKAYAVKNREGNGLWGEKKMTGKRS